MASDGRVRRPRRLEALAIPTRPVPFAATLLNPEKRHRTLAALPEGSQTNELSQISQSSVASVLPPSKSMPVLLVPLERKPRPTKIDPALYKRPYHRIYGGLDYQNSRPRVDSRFLNFQFAADEEAAERNQLRKRQMATKLLRESARLFIKADSNGDGQLDFREFVELVILQAKLQRRQEILNGTQKGKVGELPPMPSRAMLKDYFQLIDFNHSGTLSMTEFFAFSLREGLARGRTTVSTFLSVWDQDNNNMLNEDEFTRVCHALGFASITKELMKACEKDESGQIKITELTRVLRLKAEGDEKDDFFDEASKLAQRPIESLWARLGKKKRAIRNRTGQKVVHARRAVNQRGEMPQMDMKTSFAIVSELSKVDLSARKTPFYDASDEKIRAQEDITGALSILRSWMRKTGLTALDLFQAWDVNGSFSISAKELAEGLELYGLKLTIELVELVFDAMTDRYKLDYDQFKVWYDSTSKGDLLPEEERRERAAIYIQNCIRSRRARREVARRRALASPAMEQAS